MDRAGAHTSPCATGAGIHHCQRHGVPQLGLPRQFDLAQHALRGRESAGDDCVPLDAADVRPRDPPVFASAYVVVDDSAIQVVYVSCGRIQCNTSGV